MTAVLAALILSPVWITALVWLDDTLRDRTNHRHH